MNLDGKAPNLTQERGFAASDAGIFPRTAPVWTGIYEKRLAINTAERGRWQRLVRPEVKAMLARTKPLTLQLHNGNGGPWLSGQGARELISMIAKRRLWGERHQGLATGQVLICLGL